MARLNDESEREGGLYINDPDILSDVTEIAVKKVGYWIEGDCEMPQSSFSLSFSLCRTLSICSSSLLFLFFFFFYRINDIHITRNKISLFFDIM